MAGDRKSGLDHSFGAARSLPPRIEVQQVKASVRARLFGITEEVPRLDAAEEGPLDQVVDVVADLVGEEAADRLEMPLKKQVSGVAVAATPGIEELEVGWLARDDVTIPCGWGAWAPNKPCGGLHMVY